MKRSRLKSDPQKTREWQQRSRLKRPKRPRKAFVPSPTELTPYEWRRAVWHLCHGKCIATGKLTWLDGPTWEWQPHHCIKDQTLRRRGISTTIPQAGVILLTRVHEQHTTRSTAVPFEKLPLYVVEFATSLGPWAEDALLREHPRS